MEGIICLFVGCDVYISALSTVIDEINISILMV